MPEPLKDFAPWPRKPDSTPVGGLGYETGKQFGSEAGAIKFLRRYFTVRQCE